MAEELRHIGRVLKEACTGDNKSLKWLGIRHGVQYPCPPSFDPSKASKKELQRAINNVLFFAEAANRLNLRTAEEVVRIALEHMQHSYVCLIAVHRSMAH